MSAYFVFTREKMIDPEQMEIYSQKVAATLEGHPVKILAAYGKHEDVEGHPTEGTVIVEFPSMEAAMAWYDSAAYREVREHRLLGAIYHAILVQGV